MTNRLSPDQVQSYRDQGYILVERLIDAETLDALRRETDAIVEAARSVEQNDAVYDLEDSHSPDTPRVRRIKTPRLHFPFFKTLSEYQPILDVLGQLIGPDVRYQGDKLNLKSAEYGAPVEWHQDWAFYPHTNDDLLAAGVFLDDCDASNGPLLMIPGSHQGPTYDHHADGAFCGAMEPESSGIDFDAAVQVTGPAGSVSFHHTRIVHGSGLNTSGADRRLLLYQYAAADAWPLSGLGTRSLEDFDSWLVMGNGTTEPRLTDVPVRMPLPPAVHGGSIYENQKATGRRFFETYKSKSKPAPTRSS
jgi:phytanoyl-CoA hydroxylase